MEINEIHNGFRMTELGPLPDEWEVVRLGEVTQISSGGSAPQGTHYFNGKSPFIRVQHIDNEDNVIKRYDLITDEAIKNYKLRLYPKGTIVFPKSGASVYLEKRAILPMDAYIVSHLCAVNSNKENVLQLFLYYLLRSIKLSKEKADGYPTLNLSEVKQIKIPLPPLPEQQKIAAVLSTVQSAKEKTEQVINAAKELKKSMMKHLFTYGPVPLNEVDSVPLKETEIGMVPEEWDVKNFGEVVEIRKEIIDPSTGNYIYVGLEHIEPGNVMLQKTGLSNEVRSAKYKFYRNDILYAKLRPYLDKGVLVDQEGICSTDIFVFKPKESVYPRFISYLVHTNHFREHAIKTMTGVNHPRTSWRALSRLSIPLPPLPIQQKIASILSAVDEKIQAEENKKKALEELFKSLLGNLMTGKIRVHPVR